jgi:hypothetical protein
LSGIRTHDPSARASEDSLCLRPRDYCDRPTKFITRRKSHLSVTLVATNPALLHLESKPGRRGEKTNLLSFVNAPFFCSSLIRCAFQKYVVHFCLIISNYIYIGRPQVPMSLPLGMSSNVHSLFWFSTSTLRMKDVFCVFSVVLIVFGDWIAQSAYRRAERPEFDSRQGQESCHFSTASRPAPWLTQRHIQWVW